jgi:nucleotide-binding universal stress UspA family protein
MAAAWTIAGPAWGSLRRQLSCGAAMLHEVGRTSERGTTVAGLRRVVVGVSASPGSIPALRYAENLARRDDALLIAVHAWLPPGGDLADRRQPSAYLRRIWAQAAGKRLDEALDAAWGGIPADLRFEALVVRGEPGPGLVDVARSAGDLLVVGAGRRGRLARIGHGQVSRYCLAHAPCPVIAVPPADPVSGAGHRLRSWSLRRGEFAVDRALAELNGEKSGRDRR